MRPGVVVLLGALVLGTPSALGQAFVASGRVGLGVALGYPQAGLSGNIFLTGTTSLQLDGALRYHVRNKGRDEYGTGTLGLRADVLFWMRPLATGRVAVLRWYLGPGVNVGLGLGKDRGFTLGVELPVGLVVGFQRAPVEVSLELVPVLALVTPSSVELGIAFAGALHARYYF
ncbi:MAG: hypothetical protein HY909_29920 [Deltaproteobacteria bacterium]|nr:hypothetical protein [Deltaproteobacteria bacterium]